MLLLRASSSSSSRAALLPAAARWCAWACACAAIMGAGGRGALAFEGTIRGRGGAAAPGVVAAGDREDANRRGLQPNQVVIDFFDYPDGQVLNVYEQRYGVVFSPNAYAHQSSDQSKYFPIVYFVHETPGDSYFTVANGCTGSLSFAMFNSDYTEALTLTFAAYDGPSVATSAVLGQTTVTAPPRSYTTVTVPFSGVARAFGFHGPDLFDGDFTNITFTPAEPSCVDTAYWIWDPNTEQVVGELTDGAELCLPQPYNIEARPCSDPATPRVVMALKNAVTGGSVYKRNENVAPFFLWGDDPATGDVFRNLKRLADGTYSLQTTIDGVTETITFTQKCL